MRYRLLLLGLGSAAILWAAATLRWYRGHGPIAYHNECIKSAIAGAVRIQVSSIPQLPEGSKEVSFSVTNREEIVGILNHLKLPWSMRASGAFHSCSGHLRIKIIMTNAPSYDVQYDHGVGIYPIYAGGENPGFCHVPKKSCTYLNAYFTKLGYTKEQIGIH